MDRDKTNDASEKSENESMNRPSAEEAESADRNEEAPNPPHTTTGKITSPKFGSAGSGGAELEPGLRRD